MIREGWGTCPSCKRTIPLVTNNLFTLAVGVHWLEDDDYGQAGPRCPGSHMLATEALATVRGNLIHILELTR